ncbi:hypothetical protein [Aliarcobacter cryaerophilus]|uniref:Uncharacterized protein n=1 Tax=Aliarcobacter cryaerophilus TaxID=28198 RepID=A0A2S9T5N2_9BACT|nr:hypothetical protein [Aliarcobacter cryaerophilus]PRM94142.1 hypothetical protein CJ670_10340 [Arcobacter cryaerophilus gv. crypticus]
MGLGKFGNGTLESLEMGLWKVWKWDFGKFGNGTLESLEMGLQSHQIKKNGGNKFPLPKKG